MWATALPEEKVSSLTGGTEHCYGQHVSLAEGTAESKGEELKMEKLKLEIKYISLQHGR